MKPKTPMQNGRWMIKQIKKLSKAINAKVKC